MLSSQLESPSSTSYVRLLATYQLQHWPFQFKNQKKVCCSICKIHNVMLSTWKNLEKSL